MEAARLRRARFHCGECRHYDLAPAVNARLKHIIRIFFISYFILSENVLPLCNHSNGVTAQFLSSLPKNRSSRHPDENALWRWMRRSADFCCFRRACTLIQVAFARIFIAPEINHSADGAVHRLRGRRANETTNYLQLQAELQTR
jgi:hypothetical protein